MPDRTLRITQSSDSTGQYRAELALEGDGLARQTATATFDFRFDDMQREDLRWYLEDYLQYPHDPAPEIAARIEGEITDVGVDLFKKVFQSCDDARDLWATLRQKLDDTRIEISTPVAEANSIPWELIRDPKTDAAFALRAECFVRSQTQAAQAPELPNIESGPIRILLVICRPSGDGDVPFRSVAAQLIKGLGDQAEDRFQLDVLRPATYERLSRVLHEAKAAGRPYHVVHFDGHGMYAEVPDAAAMVNWLRSLIPVVLSGPRTGSHGYLLFEKPDHESNMELVDGPTLGKLLVATDVPLLVLNACRSAHAEAPSKPEAGTSDDVHAQVRAFGSLAQEVMDAGVAGVVAMRYNVYVVTAAQFVADMYQTLVQGRSLGESVSMGRKQLAAKPDRTISFDARPLQDWCVPIVYEAASIELFPQRTDGEPRFTIRSGGAATERGALDRHLPRPPDVGFFGRDETLLALDRAFDQMQIVLLHAYAGSGKTSTAAEFARWYSLTGGVDGPVLFTSFETYTPLPRVLDKIGEVFGPTLEQADIHWLALDDDERRDIALQVLKQVPVLWIWDNVEPITGISRRALAPGSDEIQSSPGDTHSPPPNEPGTSAPRLIDTTYTDDERQALVDFLRDVKQQTQAKILLTSRRDEQAWLGNLPSRIKVPPMPMQERVQLARALAEHHQRRLTDVDDWRPLLRFTQGNPLTITVLVGQALRDGLKTRAQITTFVDQLRAGEVDFDDEASEGRTRSLGASLSYGFTHAFTEDERRILALLHLFQGFVDVDVLKWMGDPQADWCLDAVRGLTRDQGIELLDRAADVGLLTAHGGGYYTIHPALPWFFKSLFDTCTDQPPGASPRLADEQSEPDASAFRLMATRAFVEAMGVLGNYYHDQYGAGNRDVIGALSVEEANILHTRRLARTHGWWHRITSAMQGLRMLYDHTGRRAEWRRLVDEIVPDFVDPATDGPLPGREEHWSLVTEYRVLLAEESRHWDEAERLQQVRVDWNRRRADQVVAAVGEESGDLTNPAAPFIAHLQPVADALNAADRNTIRSLAAALHELGEIQRERQQPECVAAYEESLAVAEAIDDHAAAATCAFNLGNAYYGDEVPAIRDLAQAEQWYRRSLELREEQDRQGRAQCLGQVGAVAFARFQESKAAGEPEAELLRHVHDALQSYQQALELLPDNAVNDLAVTHNALGAIYGDVGDIDRALPHYRKCIRCDEASGNTYGAAQTRFNVAIDLVHSGRLSDARQYALAALRDFHTYGELAADEIARTEQLLADIEQAIQEQEA